MAFTRGRYGVEHNRRPDDEETHGLRRLVVSLVAISVVASIAAHFIMKQKDAVDVEIEPAPAPRPVEKPVEKPAEKPVIPTPAPAPVAPAPEPEKTEKMLDKIRQRPTAERVLLEKLAAAERQGDAMIAIDTIERLCARPAVADLHPQLRERLGKLNMALLLSGRSTPWTALVTVKRGDSRERIARDHRTTGAALERLNEKTNWARIRPGDVVRVLQNPRAVLVVHKGLGFADLSLKGKFFKRFYFKGGKSADAGVYPISREIGKNFRTYLRKMEITFSPPDRADLEMFLAPDSSSITVSDQ